MLPSSFSLLLALVLQGCDSQTSDLSSTAADKPLFKEITGQVGLKESPPQWPDGRYQVHEISPAAIALFDYDRDGDLDVYQVVHPPPDQPNGPAPNRLLQQQADGTYRDVTTSAGVGDSGYGHGVAIGDIDNDGNEDIYVLNVHRDALYRNQGDGTFVDVTQQAGIRGSSMSTGGAFLDYDRDGDLDLYVSHYVRDDPTRVCRTGVAERRDYCGPAMYLGIADTLYRNNGDGSFVDVTKEAGIRQEWPGFGTICVDITGDGWADIYVANDRKPNQLYVNQRDGTFAESALTHGVALSGSGSAEASMGVSVGDVNRDGELDIFLTHLYDETNTLYLHSSESRGDFMDRSASSRLGGPSLPYTAWGCGLIDFDHDGDLDLALVNGRVARGAVHPNADIGSFWNDYAEPNHVFLNDGQGRFKNVSSRSSRFASRVEVSRALAFGDLDRDGDMDMVLANLDNSLRVYRNDAPTPGTHWLRVRALTGERIALGAMVTIEAGGVRQVRPVISAYSYCSANEPIAHFGLGSAPRVDSIDVLWPDGKKEAFDASDGDREITVKQGDGR